MFVTIGTINCQQVSSFVLSITFASYAFIYFWHHNIPFIKTSAWSFDRKKVEGHKYQHLYYTLLKFAVTLSGLSDVL